jgi:hypothetical protein
VFEYCRFSSFYCNYYFVFPFFDLRIESFLLHFCSITYFISLYYSASLCTAYSVFLSFAIISILDSPRIVFLSFSSAISSPTTLSYIHHISLISPHIQRLTIPYYTMSLLSPYQSTMKVALEYLPHTWNFQETFRIFR